MSEWKETEIDLIPKDWEVTKLENLVDNKRSICYGIVQPGQYDPKGIPILRVNNIRNGRIITDDILKVSKEIESKYKRTRLKAGDLLVTLVGNLGETAIVKHEYISWNLARAVGLVPLNNTVSNLWVKYCFDIPYIKHCIKAWANTTVQPTLNLKELAQLPIPIPPINEQKSITKVISCLDRKIDNLRRQNQTLEKIAQTLFKHWFIDFEFPNDDGKPYKSSGGAMVASELGDIPAGWRVGVSGEIINLQGGFAFKSEDFQDVGNHGVIKIKNISDNIVDINKTDFISDSVASKINLKFKLSSGDILIAMTGAEVAKIGVVPKTRNSFFLNQRVGLFQEKINGGKLYIYYLFSREEYQKALRDRGSGSSAQPNISASDVEDITIIIPTLSIIEKFANIAGYLFIKKCENLFQIQTLTQTRDTLLPKLMSGQIRIKEGESIIEEVK
ncbi:MAG TPA: restriction endonuclease subunit S [Candidatus Obscuribacterales bacterium]